MIQPQLASTENVPRKFSANIHFISTTSVFIAMNNIPAPHLKMFYFLGAGLCRKMIEREGDERVKIDKPRERNGKEWYLFKFSKPLGARERLEALWNSEDKTIHLFLQREFSRERRGKCEKRLGGVWPAHARCNKIRHVSESKRSI